MVGEETTVGERRAKARRWGMDRGGWGEEVGGGVQGEGACLVMVSVVCACGRCQAVLADVRAQAHATCCSVTRSRVVALPLTMATATACKPIIMTQMGR